MTPEERREYNRKYYEKNKEKIAGKQKKYRIDNKDKKIEYQREYYEKNKEKIAERHKEYSKVYSKTPAGRKSYRINNWKKFGIICDDWDVLYERYLNTELCELCNVKLTEDKSRTSTTRCLDHDHETGEVRNILCNSCNVRRK